MATVGEPRTFSQPSRKGKKAWRKNVDVTTVQAGLEEVREQITQTGGVIKEQPDDSLFVLDTAGDAVRAARHLGPAARKLKSDEILAARSAVPALPHGKKHAAAAATTDGVLPAAKKRKISSAELTRLKRLADSAAARTDAPKPHDEPMRDPWAEPAAEEAAPTKLVAKHADGARELDFLEAPRRARAPATLRHAPVSLAPRVSAVPAVRLPEPGISVNPDFAKWDELLQREGAKAVEEEKRRIAEEAEAARVLAAAEAEAGIAADDPTLEDETEFEGFSDSEEEDDESAQDGEEVGKRGPVEVKRKTQTQRNREQKQKERERRRAADAEQKRQQHELHLIRKYATAAKEREAAAKAAKEAAKPMDDESNPQVMRTKKFGMAPLPRDRLILQLPDELSESLRTLKPEGNLLSERFRSLRERGILETRAPVATKKNKKRESEKWSYKDFK